MSQNDDARDFWITENDGVWWSPDGWLVMPKPPTIAKRDSSRGVQISYEGCGFWPELTFGNNPTDGLIKIEIHSSTEALQVEIWGPSSQLARFFVARWHEVQFYVDKLPSLLAGYNRWIIDPEAAP